MDWTQIDKGIFEVKSLSYIIWSFMIRCNYKGNFLLDNDISNQFLDYSINLLRWLDFYCGVKQMKSLFMVGIVDLKFCSSKVWFFQLAWKKTFCGYKMSAHRLLFIFFSQWLVDTQTSVPFSKMDTEC